MRRLRVLPEDLGRVWVVEEADGAALGSSGAVLGRPRVEERRRGTRGEGAAEEREGVGEAVAVGRREVEERAWGRRGLLRGRGRMWMPLLPMAVTPLPETGPWPGREVREGYGESEGEDER